MKKLLPSLFSLAVLSASGQAPEGLLADTSPTPSSAPAADAPAGLELVSFEAYVAGSAEEVFLRWATAAERPGERFLLERSGDLREWTPVLELDGQGAPGTYTPYEVQDPAPLEGISYYRLRDREQGTAVELSDLFSIRRSTSEELLVHADRPGRFSVTAEGTLSDVRLLDNRGQFIPMSLDVQHDRVLIDTQLLSPGTYYVQGVVNGSPVRRPVVLTGSGIIGG